MAGLVDLNEVVKRIIKYLLLGLSIALCAVLIPKKSLNVEEIIILALSGAATFSILDCFSGPEVASSARSGAGLGLGLRLSGFML